MVILGDRLSAEEGYIRALEAIDRIPATPAPEAPYSRTKYFGDHPSTFQTALTEYTASIKEIVAQRRELVKSIKSQIKVMHGIRQNQAKQHKTINEFVGEKNSKYLTFRTNDFHKVKLDRGYCCRCFARSKANHSNDRIVQRQRAYVHKCADLDAAQHALQQMAAKEDFVMTEEDTEEPVEVSSSPREDEIVTPEAQNNSDNSNNKRGNNIVLALRSQIAQAMTSDPSKQSLKIAKLKRDVADTGAFS